MFKGKGHFLAGAYLGKRDESSSSPLQYLVADSTVSFDILQVLSLGIPHAVLTMIVSRIFRTFVLVTSTGFLLTLPIPGLFLKAVHLQILP